MKRFLPTAALTLLSLLGLGTHEAQASHAQGGDLRYEFQGNNQYRVSLRFFRDCSGINAPTSLTLNCKVGTPATVCSGTNAQNFSTTLSRAALPVYGSQYCATVTGICTANGPDNYEENRYEATVTLPGNQWVLSAEESARPSLANVSGQNSLFFEATLDNRNGLANTSPNFASAPANFVPYNQLTTLATAAFDLDGDSLAYSLISPLEGCNQPSAYANLPAITLAPMGGCTPTLSAAFPARYSTTYPLPSVLTTGACPALTATPAFGFNPANGAMQFIPVAYTASSTSGQGLNKYVVVVKIEEWRRVGGGRRLVGSVRRELFLNVYDCGPNQMPRFASTMQVFNMGTVAPGTEVPVRSGTSTSVILTATDGNSGQILSFAANATAVPGVFSQQTSPTSMVLEFTPPATLPDGVYYVSVKAEDNNCPLKGSENQTLAFRVFGSPLSARAKAPEMVSTAFPNPFAEQVRFSLRRPAAGSQAVYIVDQLGRVVQQLSAPAGAASATTELSWRPAPGTPAGVYLARFADGQQTVRLLYLAQ